MSRSKKVPASGVDGTLSNVAHPAAEVLPPDGWVKRSPLGFLGYADGDLARLGDVLLWLEHTKGLPRAASVDELVQLMPEDVMASLYYISRADEFGGERYADLMPPDSTFSGPGSLPRPARRTEQEHQATLEAARLARDPNAKTGRAALVDQIQRWAAVPVVEQTDPVNKPTSHAARLAVPMNLAFWWWDYGQLATQQAAPAGADTETDSGPDVSTWAGLVESRRQKPGGKWAPEMKKTVAKEERRRAGTSGARKAMASELRSPVRDGGISVARLGQLVSEGERFLESAPSKT